MDEARAAAVRVLGAPAIGEEQVKQFNKVLQEYKTGKAQTEQRILASEDWWKLRNTRQEQKTTELGKDGGFKSVSGWLHNVIVSKHADAMDAYPAPVILPREQDDRGEATVLSAIIPCILEQNHFESTYSDTMWQKLKTGTGAYKVVWDAGKLNGLGDIAIARVNLLNLYWEPGVTDIQLSRYFFHAELYDKEVLREMYPDLLKDRLKGQTFMSTKFLYDDTVNNSDKATVIEVYYHKYVDGQKILQYCKYVEDVVLYATENDPELAGKGLYDHGKYPYVFDALFPIEGSPCGYGYVDLCKNPQTEIDLLNTAFVKNAMVGAVPRYFSRSDGAINEEELLDLSKPVVHINGNVDDGYLRKIEHNTLDGVYVNLLDRVIQELRDATGTTETSTGNIQSGVTAASAIAALQEASGKGSRDSTAASYRAYGQIVDLCIELIRQFYDLPRQFRIVGQYGMERFISYTNKGIQPIHQGTDFGADMGYRLPVFDIKISAQKKTAYSRMAQNELAIQLYQLGFFNPQMTDQALMTLDMMEFDGKDELMQKISRNGTMYQMLAQYMQMALMLAQKYEPNMVPGLSQDIAMSMGGASPAMGSRGFVTDNSVGGKRESANVKNARQQSNNASQPEGGGAK